MKKLKELNTTQILRLYVENASRKEGGKSVMGAIYALRKNRKRILFWGLIDKLFRFNFQ